jgi:hypothetical protein
VIERAGAERSGFPCAVYDITLRFIPIACFVTILVFIVQYMIQKFPFCLYATYAELRKFLGSLGNILAPTILCDNVT